MQQKVTTDSQIKNTTVNTQSKKTTQRNYNHIPYNDSEDGTKLTSRKCYLKSLTCVIDSGRLFSLILILTVPPDT